MGMIFDIQRCTYHDGPGIRTTVFFKGCPLRCAWCHNPESFLPGPQLRFYSQSCSHCGGCVCQCPQNAHSIQSGVHTVDFSRCIACGACTAACPNGALELVGREVSVQEIMELVLRDRAYYDASGGGLTVSGGEPTMQPEFLAQLLRAAKAEGIHTCVETNGYIPKAVLATIAPLTELFLIDYKLSEGEGLTPYTLAQGDLWQNTMEELTRLQKPVILRLPIIPGINDTAAHMEAAAAYRRAHPNVQSLEIMPYHAMGKSKWEQLGLSYRFPALPSATAEQAAAWKQLLSQFERE